MENFLTIKEASDFLHISPETLKRKCRAGLLTYYKHHGKTCPLKFQKSDLVAFMSSGKVDARTTKEQQ